MSPEEVDLFEKYFRKDLSEKELGDFKLLVSTTVGRRSFVRYADEIGQIIHSTRQIVRVEEENAVYSELVHRSEEKLLEKIQHDSIPNLEEPAIKETSTQIKVYLSYLSFTLAAFFLFYVFWNPGEDELLKSQVVQINDQLIKSVARVTLLNGKANVKEYDWLNPGEILLDSGELEITFDSGVVVLLQGPSQLNLNGPQRAFLKSGKMTARVPEEAVNFVISTPQGTVVDLGTEFAVSVQEDEAMEVHVLEGAVEAGSLEWENPRLLKQNQALRIDKNGAKSTETLSKLEQFSRIRQAVPELKYNYVYWPFDKELNKLVLDQGNMGFGGRFDLNLTKGGQIHNGGKYGNALWLNGKQQYATSNFQGIGQANARTVAFWVKIPPDTKISEAYSMVSWGGQGPSEKWQIAYNQAIGEGRVGAIRTEFEKGYIIGTTDLRDGRWHHIVSLFIGGEDANVATHIRHYVDGKLESVSGFLPKKVNTKISGNNTQPVYLGKYIDHDRWYFRGSLDELFIFDGALTPGQILKLKLNQLIDDKVPN